MQLIGMNAPVAWCGSEALRAYERWHQTLAILVHLDPRSVAERIENGEVYCLDVRTASEFESGHMPSAISIPLNVLPANVTKLLDGKPVVVYCAGGNRSPIAASLLHRAGKTNLISMPAGFADWKALGLPVESKAPSLV